jgi:hypothetical protein
MTENTKNTKRLYVAAAYVACGAKLANVDKTDPLHMEFTFSEGKDMRLTLDKIELQWGDGTLMVKATDYANAIVRLLSIVHPK